MSFSSFTGIRSITVGSGNHSVCCWSEVLCFKGECFDAAAYDTVHMLWRRARGAILVVDALKCFEYGNVEETIERMLEQCRQIERDVLGCETQLLIAVTKCDLLPVTAKEIFGNILEQYGIDYVWTSSKDWNSENGCVKPHSILSILSRKMLEWHLNFEPKNTNDVQLMR